MELYLTFNKIFNILFTYMVVRFFDFFFVEGFIKPTIASWGQRTISSLLPPLYDLTDRTVLELLPAGNKEIIIKYVRENILLLKEDANKKQIDYLLDQWQEKFDVLAAVEKKNNMRCQGQN